MLRTLTLTSTANFFSLPTANFFYANAETSTLDSAFATSTANCQLFFVNAEASTRATQLGSSNFFLRTLRPFCNGRLSVQFFSGPSRLFGDKNLKASCLIWKLNSGLVVCWNVYNRWQTIETFHNRTVLKLRFQNLVLHSWTAFGTWCVPLFSCYSFGCNSCSL